MRPSRVPPARGRLSDAALVGSPGDNWRRRSIWRGRAARRHALCPTVGAVRPGIGLHPAVPAQRAARRRHRARALRAGRSRPGQRFRRGDDERAPRRLRRVHGAAAADGVLRLGRARDGVGGGGAAPSSTPVNGAGRRGGRVAPGSSSRARRARRGGGRLCRWTSRRPASARPMPSTASRRNSLGSWRCSAVRSWASWKGTRRCSPAAKLRFPCSARPCRLPRPFEQPGAGQGS